ncbi:MAG: insulinase family protein [Phycisphaerales bacterium]|nr:insulinase family protein [Phycisphaerales bacterium]
MNTSTMNTINTISGIRNRVSATVSSSALLMASLALVAVLPAAARADDVVKRPEQLTFPPLVFFAPEAKEFRSTLSDGTPVYLAPSREFPLINLTLTAVGGANLDPVGKEGLAAITASMLRHGGTQSMSASEVDEALDFLATKCDLKPGKFNSLASLNSLAANFPESLRLFTEILRSPRFDESKLKLELAERVENLKQRNDAADGILAREWKFALYGEDHFESNQPTAAGLSSITTDDMRKFAANIFHPGNFLITVTGDFEPKAMLASLENAFAGWQPGARNAAPTAPTYTLVPGLYHIEKDIPQGKVAIGMRSIKRDDPDYIPFMVMNDILGGGGFSSRIMQRVRSDEGLAYSAGSQFQPGIYYPGEFRASFESKNPTVALAIELILNEIARIRSEPVSANELEVAKLSFIETFPRTFESKDATLGVFVNDEMTARPEGYWQSYRDKIRAVTPADITRVAQKYLTPDQMVIMVVGKWSEIEPGDPTGRANMGQFGKVNHLPLRDPLTMEPLRFD